MKRSLIFAAALLFGVGAYAKGPNNIEGKTVPHVKIRDLQNQPIDLPYLGKAPLLLFYVDPDHAGQNSDFIAYLEEHQIGGDKIQAYGIVNLKDAPLLPNGVVRSMMRSKQKKTGAAMYTDVDCSLRDAWGGRCQQPVCHYFREQGPQGGVFPLRRLYRKRQGGLLEGRQQIQIM